MNSSARPTRVLPRHQSGTKELHEKHAHAYRVIAVFAFEPVDTILLLLVISTLQFGLASPNTSSVRYGNRRT